MLRAAERIESDASFLRLYSPLVLESFLDIHQSGNLWNNVLFIRSSPGAGKTSLLRLFEPTALITLHNRKSGDEFKELFRMLRKLDVVSDESIQVLGVNLAFTRNYEILEDFTGLSTGNKNRLFFSLLNSRIITATLRAALALKKLRFPEDLDKISFTYNNAELFFKKIDVPCNGFQLYEWAANIERSIYNLLDSFLPVTNDTIEGHSELFSTIVLKPEYLQYEGKPVSQRILFMLDDLHKLSSAQRDYLITYLLEKRSNVSIWLSERLEALNNLRTNAGRDYLELNLENYWKDHEAKFEKLLINIASKRAADSREEVDFALESQLNEDELHDVLKEARRVLMENIQALTADTIKFDVWKSFLRNFDGSDLDACIQAKRVEILIHRNLARRELALDFSLTLEELEEKTDEKVLTAARLLLSKQFSIPYYYGTSTLARISTNNIDQFLSFSAPLYERMLSMHLNMDNVIISAKDQDKEIKRIANEKWKELQKMIPESTMVMRFLENFCRFCNTETYKPSASYAPGVNGFYIDAARTVKLIQEEDWLSNLLFEDLEIVLNNCLAFNLLHIKETMQGKKGQKKIIYYLNRWLCVKFDLPLNYGGWRPKKPDELLRWTRK